jgi:hypothetical protein
MTCSDQNIGKLIGSYELGLLTNKERQQFENHLLDCEYCFQSLYRTAPIANLMRDGKVAPTRSIELADEEDKPVPGQHLGRRLTRFLGKKWAYAIAGAAAAMILVFLAVWIIGPGKETERFRGHDEVSILVHSPIGEVAVLKEIRWKAIRGIPSYKVRIYTDAGDLVWEESIEGDSIIIPDSIGEILIPGQNYRWQVEALTAEEDGLKSQLIWFRIRK